MSKKADAILQEALSLPEGERADVAAAIIESLEPPADSDVEEAWKLEVAKRLSDLDAGLVETVPWEQVRDSLFSRLRDSQD